MSDLGGKRRGGRGGRFRTIPLSFEQKNFVAAHDTIRGASLDEVHYGKTDTENHKLVAAAKTYADIYDAAKATPLRSFFAVHAAYNDFKSTAENSTGFQIDSARDMLAAVRGHNLAIRQRTALGASNRGEEIAIPADLLAAQTGVGYNTKVGAFSRAAAGRVFAEMVQQYYDVQVRYERDHAAPHSLKA